MMRYFCDHCGKEVDDLYIVEDDDLIESSYAESRRFLRKHLCRECYHERLQLHISLDLDFFHEREEG